MSSEAPHMSAFPQAPIECIDQIQQGQAVNETQRIGIISRIKQYAGRAALVLSLAAGGFAATVAAEAATGHEAAAQAEGPNGAELAWCRWPSRYALCNKANGLAGVALREAQGVEKRTGWALEDGGADAVRHCYWNALMTKEMGRSTAAGFAWRHEYNDQFGSRASNMDLHNNLKGRDYGSSSNPLQKCVDGVNNGQLVRLRF